MNMQNFALSLEHVRAQYGRGPLILDDITLGIKAGSFTFLTGASGAGKSTLLKLIYLKMPPIRGQIHLFGQNIGELSDYERQNIKRRIGVVLQDFQLIEHLNVFDNVALPLRIMGQSYKSYQSDTQDLLRWVGLGDKMHAFPATLSGGEKQRVAIARAVITKPDLLIADEPTGNVDADMGARLLRLFSEMNRQGTTVFIATHNQSMMEQFDGIKLHLDAGKIVESPA